MATSQEILEPLDEQRIIERELNLQNRLYPRPDRPENPESGNPNKQNKRRRPGSRQRKRARLNYHRVHCSVCNHPERDAIEEGFLMWQRPTELAREFGLSHRTAIYRHAQAFGLFQQRGRALRFVLEKVMEESTLKAPSADSMIRAVRAYSCLDEDGHWHEHPRRVIITHETIERPPTIPEKDEKLFATPREQKID
jgi:hypothetical protein